MLLGDKRMSFKIGDKVYWKPEALVRYKGLFNVVGDWEVDTLGYIREAGDREDDSHIQGKPYDWCIDVDGTSFPGLYRSVWVHNEDIIQATGQIPLPLRFG